MFIYLAAVLIRSGMLTWSNIMKLDHINELDHINNRVDYLVTCTILRCRLCKSGSQSFHIVSDVMVTTPVAEHDHFYQPLMKLLDSLSPPTIFGVHVAEELYIYGPFTIESRITSHGRQWYLSINLYLNGLHLLKVLDIEHISMVISIVSRFQVLLKAFFIGLAALPSATSDLATKAWRRASATIMLLTGSREPILAFCFAQLVMCLMPTGMR
ncbi:hypothetical protein KCU93_g205, partial [Aureobasidium melanogenum]